MASVFLWVPSTACENNIRDSSSPLEKGEGVYTFRLITHDLHKNDLYVCERSLTSAFYLKGIKQEVMEFLVAYKCVVDLKSHFKVHV